MNRAVLARLIELFPPLDTAWCDDLRREWWRLCLSLADAACESDGYAPFDVTASATGTASLPWSVSVPHD